MELITGYANMKVADYLIKESPKKVCLIFYHGVGDVVMFLPSLAKLRSLFPETKIDIALQEGVGQEKLIPDAILITSANEPIEGYEYTCQIHFPMCEHMAGTYTKQGWCCVQELGIDPVDDYPKLTEYPNRLVALHLQATALPGACNPSEEVAEKIWNEVKSAGFIPIESLFVHKYFNPVNAQFACVDRGVRDIQAGIDKLIGLLGACTASICCASGNLPLSIAIMPKRVLYLKKDFSINCYTKEPIPEIDVNNYEPGSVKEWLKKLK